MINNGGQILTIRYKQAGSSANMARLLYGVVPTGIYGEVTLTTGTAPLTVNTVCANTKWQALIQDRDDDYVFKVDFTTEASAIAVSASLPIVVMRYKHILGIDNYVELKAVTDSGIGDPLDQLKPNDLILGEVLFSNPSTISGFDYSRQHKSSFYSLLTEETELQVTPKSSTDFTINIAGGSLVIDGQPITIAAQSLTFDTPTQNRYDLLVFNTSGAVSVIKGTEVAGTPTRPTLTSTSMLPFACVYVSDNVHQLTTAQIQNYIIPKNITWKSGEVGTISSLTTTVKTSTVAAINELDNDVGNLSTLTTTHTGQLSTLTPENILHNSEFQINTVNNFLQSTIQIASGTLVANRWRAFYEATGGTAAAVTRTLVSNSPLSANYLSLVKADSDTAPTTLSTLRASQAIETPLSLQSATSFTMSAYARHNGTGSLNGRPLYLTVELWAAGVYKGYLRKSQGALSSTFALYTAVFNASDALTENLGGYANLGAALAACDVVKFQVSSDVADHMIVGTGLQIALPQVIPGSAYMKARVRSIQEESILCSRYYWGQGTIVEPETTLFLYGLGYAVTTSKIWLPIQNPVPFRIIPTPTISTALAPYSLIKIVSTDWNGVQPTLQITTPSLSHTYLEVTIQSGSMAQGDQYALEVYTEGSGASTDSVYLSLDAEL